MKTFGKVLSSIGFLTIGYFVGFYEYKYKVIKTMLEGKLKEEMEQRKDTENKE